MAYNGWTNYETWVTALWIDNDQGSYSYSRELVAEAVEDSGHPISAAADALKDWQESYMPEVEGVFADLLNAAFGEVNWHEIAENFLEEEAA